MGLVSCTKSGNSSWNERLYHKHESSSGQFRVVDNTGIPRRKRVIIILRNITSGDSDYFPWYDLYISPNQVAYFDFQGSNVVSTVYGPITATNGRKYGISDSSVTDIGTSAGGSEFAVTNNSSIAQTFSILRNNHRIVERTIDPSDSLSFGYHPTFYIAVTDGDLPSLSDINTEMSVLGIATADISVEFSSVYTMTFANIVFA